MEWGLSRCLPTDGAEEEAAGGMPGPGCRLRRSAEMCLISTDIIWRPQTALPFSGGGEISLRRDERRRGGKKNWRCFRAGFGVKKERGGEPGKGMNRRTIFCADSEGCYSSVQFISPFTLLQLKPTCIWRQSSDRFTGILWYSFTPPVLTE